MVYMGEYMPELFALTPTNTEHKHIHTQRQTHLPIKDLLDLIDLFHSLVGQTGTSTHTNTPAHSQASYMLACTRKTKFNLDNHDQYVWVCATCI